jgi:beta-phosphoglucomutase-like phosphatase (HAD superfamily)
MDLTDGAVSTRVIREILAAGREMLMHPVEPLPGVDEALAELSDQGYRLVLITKGDLCTRSRSWPPRALASCSRRSRSSARRTSTPIAASSPATARALNARRWSAIR